MELATALCLGFVFHLVGDYLIQNDWMANEKTKSFTPALIHAFLYSILFLLLTPSIWWVLIFLSHFFIDRYRLATYWIKLVNWNWNSTNFGFDDNKPLWMSVWLMIIIDNAFHVLFNTAAIYLHYTF